MTDLHRLSSIQQSCCAETWTCPCRGRLNTTEVRLLLVAHDVGDAGCYRPQSPLPVDGSQLERKRADRDEVQDRLSHLVNQVATHVLRLRDA